MVRDDQELAVECEVFAAYLTGLPAGDYVLEKYREAHRTTDLIGPSAPTPFDRFILRFARRGPLCTKLADIYTRWLYRTCVLRRKLLLMLAILECAGTTYRHFEAGQCRTRFGFGLWLAGRTIGFAACATVAVTLFTVARCVLGSSAEPAETAPGRGS
jgi:hypothetical protein